MMLNKALVLLIKSNFQSSMLRQHMEKCLMQYNNNFNWPNYYLQVRSKINYPPAQINMYYN